MGQRKIQTPTPPDGGYGYVVVFASFWCNAIVEGCITSVGVFLPHFVDVFGSSGTRTAIAGSLLIGGFLAFGPLTSVLIDWLDCRRVTIVGAIFTTLAFALSTFSPNIEVFTFVYGFLGGLGVSMIFLPATVMVGYYFERRRSFAAGVAYSGAGVGMVLMPLVAALLLTYLPLRDSLILFSAFPLHCAVFGSLMRPLQLPSALSSSPGACSDSANMENLKSQENGDASPIHSINNDSGKINQSVNITGEINHSSPLWNEEDSAIFNNGKHEDYKEVAKESVGANRKYFRSLSNSESTPNIALMNEKHSSETPAEDTDGMHDESSRLRGSCQNLENCSQNFSIQEKIKPRNRQKFMSCQEISSLPDDIFQRINTPTLRRQVLKPLARRDIYYSGNIANLPEFKKHGNDREKYVASVTMLAIANDDLTEDDHGEVYRSKSSRGCCRLSPSKNPAVILRDLFHLELLVNPYFLVICLSCVFIQLGYFVPIVFIPVYAWTLGNSRTQAASLIAAMGIANVIGRVGGGALGNLHFVNELHLNNFTLYLAGLATFVPTFLQSYPCLLIYSAVYGAAVGVFVPLNTVFIVKYLGLQQLNHAMGLLTLVKGIASAIGPPIAALLMENYEGFQPVFYFAAAMFLIAGTSFYMLELVDKCNNKRETSQ